MRPLAKTLEEMTRIQWAILPASLRAMLSVMDGEELTAEDYRFFHAVGQEDKERIQAAEQFGTPAPDSLYTFRDSNVGYLLIDGPIIPRATWFSQVSGLVSMDRLTAEFKALEEDPRIDTIVLLFDSPGGAVPGVSDFAKLVRASKKSTVGFAWMAASAAYWIATAADVLITPDTGIVGSIGTVLTLTDYTDYDAKRGIKQIDIVSSQSPNKRPDFRTPEGKAVYQKLVDDLSAVFIDTVAENRGVDVETVLSRFGAGAMVVAGRALEAGMIDEIEDLESLTKGLKSGGDSLPGFSMSATEAAETKENSMKKDKTENAVELKDDPRVEELLDAARVEAREEGFSAGVEAERGRIQAIEGISAKFDGALPAVQAAALKVINAEKFNPEATVASTTAAVLDVVATAQTGAVEDFGKGRREAATAAGHAGKATPAATEAAAGVEESEAKADRLIAARDAREGKVK